MVGISGSVMDTAGRTGWVVLRMSEPPSAFQSTPHAENRTSAAVERMRDRMVVLPLSPCHQTRGQRTGGHRVDHPASVVLKCFT